MSVLINQQCYFYQHFYFEGKNVIPLFFLSGICTLGYVLTRLMIRSSFQRSRVLTPAPLYLIIYLIKHTALCFNKIQRYEYFFKLVFETLLDCYLQLVELLQFYKFIYTLFNLFITSLNFLNARQRSPSIPSTQSFVFFTNHYLSHSFIYVFVKALLDQQKSLS